MDLIPSLTVASSCDTVCVARMGNQMKVIEEFCMGINPMERPFQSQGLL